MKRVVITGLGAVSPVGNTTAEFWENICAGKHGIGNITRFDTDDFKVKIAAEVKNFDPSVYYNDKSEVRRTDLFVQYAMAAAVQAMEDSGLEDIDSERLGVYAGSGVGGINTFSAEHKKLSERGPSRVSPFFITMLITNMASGTIAMRFNAKGPTLPAVTACATGTNTIGEAFRTIKHGYADAIIAGGSEACVCPIAIAGFTNCNALCENNDTERSSTPFDRDRSGFVLGEGAGMVVLEEYEHAVSRGAKLYGEVIGYGNTCDAYHITSPDPAAEQASRAIALALKEGGLEQVENIYINAHGTSTPMNDKTETKAIKKVFGKNAYKIPVSSTKGMTGHMLGAAGGIELVASVLALRDGIIPPTIGYRTADEECDLDYVPNVMKKLQMEYAMSNSFGFGGHNASLLIKKID